MKTFKDEIQDWLFDLPSKTYFDGVQDVAVSMSVFPDVFRWVLDVNDLISTFNKFDEVWYLEQTRKVEEDYYFNRLINFTDYYQESDLQKLYDEVNRLQDIFIKERAGIQSNVERVESIIKRLEETDVYYEVAQALREGLLDYSNDVQEGFELKVYQPFSHLKEAILNGREKELTPGVIEFTSKEISYVDQGGQKKLVRYTGSGNIKTASFMSNYLFLDIEVPIIEFSTHEEGELLGIGEVIRTREYDLENFLVQDICLSITGGSVELCDFDESYFDEAEWNNEKITGGDKVREEDIETIEYEWSGRLNWDPSPIKYLSSNNILSGSTFDIEI